MPNTRFAAAPPFRNARSSCLEGRDAPRPEDKKKVKGAKGSLDDRSDADLMLVARTDRAAFEQLYHRHRASVLRFATRRAPGPEEVVDMVAAVWLEVVASIDRFDPSKGDALPWILGIAANLCASERRKNAREREAIRRLGGRRALESDDVARLERAIDAAAVAPRLRRALAQLPPSERAVAEMVMLDDMTPKQVSDALRIRPSAVRMRLARARRKLRVVAENQGSRAQPDLREVSR